MVFIIFRINLYCTGKQNLSLPSFTIMNSTNLRKSLNGKPTWFVSVFKGIRCLIVGTFLLIIPAIHSMAQRVPMDPMHTVGVESCGECHEEIVESWQQTAHSQSFEFLAKTDAAKQIAGIMGIQVAEIATSASCVRCHFTQESFSGMPQTTAAVSCESCHGPADTWIDEHNRKSLSREARVENAVAKGMIHPGALSTISQVCYQCHVVDDEQLVNKAGHPATSKGFEILTWYSGEPNHNFLVEIPGKKVKTHSEKLQQIPQERKRMLYLIGKLQHLSRSLTALSLAKDPPVDRQGKFIKLENGNYTYGVQHAIEVRRLQAEIKDIQTRVSIPEYAKALAIVSTLTFTTGEQRTQRQAGEEILQLAVQFGSNHQGSEFAVIDPFINQLQPRLSAAAGAGASGGSQSNELTVLR